MNNPIIPNINIPGKIIEASGNDIDCFCCFKTRKTPHVCTKEVDTVIPK